MRKYFFLLVFTLFSTVQMTSADTPTLCTALYSPVCGTAPVQCIMAPCYPMRETYSNMCQANVAGATDIRSDECSLSIDLPTLSMKLSPYEALQVGNWVLQSYNGKILSLPGTMTFDRERFALKLCNNVSGRYNVSRGGKFFTRQVMSTKMYCDSDSARLEQAMSGGGYALSVGSENLTLTTRSGDVIVWGR